MQKKTNITFNVINSKKRPASVTADNSEFRDIQSVEIKSSEKNSCRILFDSIDSIEEKILNEQFYS